MKFHIFVLAVQYLYWPVDELKSKANNLEWTQRCTLALLSTNSMQLGSHKILHKQSKYAHVRVIYSFGKWNSSIDEMLKSEIICFQHNSRDAKEWEKFCFQHNN